MVEQKKSYKKKPLKKYKEVVKETTDWMQPNLTLKTSISAFIEPSLYNNDLLFLYYREPAFY